MRVAVNAHLSFGMVNVPVGVSPSTSRQADVSFKTLHAGCEAPIKQDKVCSKCGKQHLDGPDIVKAIEVAKGQYVTFTQSELAELLPERSPIIALEGFLPYEMLNHEHVEASYWLTPALAFQVPYAVLMDAMIATGLAGVGKCCLWGKEHLCAVLVEAEVLALHLLTNPSHLIEPDFTVPKAPKEAVALAEELLKRSYAGNQVNLSELAPSRSREVTALVQSKMAGLELKPAVEVTPDTTVDLMAALKASMSELKPKKKKAAA